MSHPSLSHTSSSLLGAPAVFTIAPHIGFIDAVADGLIARCGGDTLKLARMQVLLPNRRSVRALTEAFVRRSAGGLLLPRMTPIADIGQDETIGSLFASIESELAAGDALLPAIDPVRRRLLLAQMVRRWRAARGDRVNAVEGLRLADQLAAAFDAIAREGIDPATITRAVPDGLAEHWQQTFDFFTLMLDVWPGLLAAEGATEAVGRSNRLVERLAARWQAVPPPGLVVAAGMTAATPAQARLLGVVARLPDGLLVLPGLDTAMTAAQWDAIICAPDRSPAETGRPETEPAALRNSEVHPQFGLKQLLQRIDVARDAVRTWPSETVSSTPVERVAAVARAMSPAAFTGDWRHNAVAAAWFDGVSILEAADQNAEAQAIALALRHSLETPGATAALVTPDRNLARRVVAHCVRWGIEIDDSAGTRLSTTPPGALALALVEAAAQHFAPVALLAVLKHPLVSPIGAAPDARRAWLAHVRQLDIDLRGVRPAPGLDGIAALLDEIDRAAKSPARAALGPWWAQLTPLLAPLETLFAAPQLTLPALVAALVAGLEALAPESIWRGPAGRKLGELLAGLSEHGAALAGFEPLDAPALLGTFLAEAPVRPAHGKHPRLAIWGLIEARLQSADLVIMAGLNDGVWPAQPAPDPWLAPAIRQQLGMPGLETAIGMAAHDFVAGLGAPRVLLTRARRDDGGPAVPSRFWLRLRALAGDALPEADTLQLLARAIDAAGPPVPALRPAPAPPANQRPRRLSITAAEKLRADPFSFYAQTMLKLGVLDPLDADPSGAERGIAVHQILQHWIDSGDSDPARLHGLAEAELLRWSNHPMMRALWAPRVRRAMDWIIDVMRDWEAEGWTPIKAEARGEHAFAFGTRGEQVVTLVGVADRVDRRADGSLAIVDYKTGTVPSHAQIIGGFALQMGLLGALVQAGVLADVPKAAVAAFGYWKISGGTDPGKISDPLLHNRKPVMTAAAHIDAAVAQFRSLCEEMLLGAAPFTAKLHPDHAEKYRDYDHLARVAEWLGKPGTPS